MRDFLLDFDTIKEYIQGPFSDQDDYGLPGGRRGIVALFASRRQTTGQRIMAKKTFETALTRLEQITEELEQGELSLEQSLKIFDEGVKLAAFCNEQLADAKAKVEMLLEKSGKVETVPFEEQDFGDSALPE